MPSMILIAILRIELTSLLNVRSICSHCCFTSYCTDAPIVSISPPSPRKIDVGDFLLLLCNAEGLPTPTVQWYKGDDAIGDHDLSEKIYYVPTTTPHTTVYTCVSRNKAGGKTRTVNANITIIVQRKSYRYIILLILLLWSTFLHI